MICAGKLEIPQEALYKKNVLITRGRFRPFTLLHNDMLMGAASQFFCTSSDGANLASQDGDAYQECVYRDDTLVLLELTTRDMMEVRALLLSVRQLYVSGLHGNGQAPVSPSGCRLWCPSPEEHAVPTGAVGVLWEIA